MTKAYTAPKHCTGITFSTGRSLSCEDGGTVTAPEDLTASEEADLLRNGFIPVPDQAPEASAPASAPKTAAKTPADG